MKDKTLAEIDEMISFGWRTSECFRELLDLDARKDFDAVRKKYLNFGLVGPDAAERLVEYRKEMHRILQPRWSVEAFEVFYITDDDEEGVAAVMLYVTGDYRPSPVLRLDDVMLKSGKDYTAGCDGMLMSIELIRRDWDDVVLSFVDKWNGATVSIDSFGGKGMAKFFEAPEGYDWHTLNVVLREVRKNEEPSRAKSNTGSERVIDL